MRFVENFDIFPTAIVRTGMFGTIEENCLNEISAILSVRPDDEALSDLLAEWDGCIYLSVNEDKDWEATAPIERTTD